MNFDVAVFLWGTLATTIVWCATITSPHRVASCAIVVAGIVTGEWKEKADGLEEGQRTQLEASPSDWLKRAEQTGLSLIRPSRLRAQPFVLVAMLVDLAAVVVCWLGNKPHPGQATQLARSVMEELPSPVNRSLFAFFLEYLAACRNPRQVW